MSWDVAERTYLAGYDAYQGHGPRACCPFRLTGDKRIGLWVAGKDAARKRISRTLGWRAFLTREKAVL